MSPVAVVAGNVGVLDYLLPTASVISAGALAYLARKVGGWTGRLNRQMDEHDWLMQQVDANTKAIKKTLERLDRQDREAKRRAPR